MNLAAAALLHATRIWIDQDTRKECQAQVCFRWADVRRVEEDRNTGLDRWEHTGPITFIVADGHGYHLLGEFHTWQALWFNYTSSAHALLFAHN